jgi:hypothetical protein
MRTAIVAIMNRAITAMKASKTHGVDVTVTSNVLDG